MTTQSHNLSRPLAVFFIFDKVKTTYILRSDVLSILLYMARSTGEANQQISYVYKLQVCIKKFLRSILRIWWSDVISGRGAVETLLNRLLMIDKVATGGVR